MTFMIKGISDIKRRYTLELVDGDKKKGASCMLVCISLYKVTHDNTTAVCYRTIFSKDVTKEFFEKEKECVKRNFEDMKKKFERKSE